MDTKKLSHEQAEQIHVLLTDAMRQENSESLSEALHLLANFLDREQLERATDVLEDLMDDYIELAGEPDRSTIEMTLADHMKLDEILDPIGMEF